MLKKIFPLFFVLFIACTVFGNEEFAIFPHRGWTATDFEIQISGKGVAGAEKSKLGVRNHYKLSNENGSFGSVTSRFVSWGTVSNSWKEFDIYDDGKYGLLGTIRGISCDSYAVCFEISDWTGTVFAKANVDLKNGIVKVFQEGKADNVHAYYKAKRDNSGELYWAYRKLNRWFSTHTFHALAVILADYFPPTNAYED